MSKILRKKLLLEHYDIMINEIENIIRYDHITICTTITCVYLHCNDRVDKIILIIFNNDI